MKRTFSKAFVFALVLCSVLPAQQSTWRSDQTDLTIRRETKLIQVPVIVRDSKNQPVLGLTAADFAIFENKVAKDIATFEEITPSAQADAMRREAKSLPQGLYTNADSISQTNKPILIVVFDTASLDFESGARMRLKLVEFLKSLRSNDQRMCLFITMRNGLVPLHLYTKDPAVLIAALNRVAVSKNSTNSQSALPQPRSGPQPLNSIDIGFEMRTVSALVSGNDPFDGFSVMERIASSYAILNALKGLAGYFQTVPGRKSLVWIGGQLPLDVGSGQSSQDYSGTYLSTFEALVNANIAVYPLSAAGIAPNVSPVVASGQDARNPLGQTMFSRGDLRTQVNFGGGGGNVFDYIHVPRQTEDMKRIAELTGGQALYGSNDTLALIDRAVKDGEHHYLLGYYLPPDAKPGRYSIDVRVKKKGVQKPRYRNRLFVKDRLISNEEELEAAKSSFLEFTDLPLQVKLPPKSPTKELPFDVIVSGKDFALSEDGEVNVDVIAVARKVDGTFIEHVSRSIRGKIKNISDFTSRKVTYSSQFTKVDQEAVLRFIVRDNVSGRIGSVIVDRP